MADLNNYYWFALVVQHGGFSAAERATDTPKSKLSRRIQQLETDLGVRLIQRTSRHFVVTDVGMNVYRHAQRMMVEAQAAQDAVAQLQATPRGVIRVSVPVNIAQHDLSQLMPAFLKRYPDINVQLIVTNRRVDIINENIDVALRVRDKLDTDASLIVRRFGQVNHVFVASPQYIQHHGQPTSPSELSQHHTLNMVEDEAHQYWELHSTTGELTRVKINPRITGSSLSMLLQFAIDGMGIALLPERLCAQHINHGRLNVLLPDWQLPQGTFHAVYASRRGLLPAVRVFIEYLVEEIPKRINKEQPVTLSE